ncbi:MAG TPA: TfoX/Sxy family protein [Rhizomicrobium sp.]|jgi:DNA transformation protein|nr:TfoX/Sxy family protein [Rhizomicrobium sp.]
MLSLEYRAFLEELFAGLGRVKVQRMFNFDGLFCGQTIFGVVWDERVFLKTDEASRSDFATEGAGPFAYRARDGREIITSYYELPARLLDDPEEAVAWARRAYDVALRSPTSQRKARKRMKAKTARQPPRRRTQS